MRVNRGQAALALLCVTGLIAGCGGSSSSSSSVSHIRTLNATTNGDYLTVLVNGAATFGQQILTGVAPSYLYINPGTSTFSYATFVDGGATTSNLPLNVNAYNTTATINSSVYYTAYAIGRPDLVTTITSLPLPYGSMQTVVYPDTHSTPASGSVNVRFLNAAPDANGTGAVDFAIDGTNVADNVGFGNMNTTTSTFSTTTSGSHTIQVYKTGTHNLISATNVNLTFANQKSETLILQEPTAAPIPAPTTFTYRIQQIEDN